MSALAAAAMLLAGFCSTSLAASPMGRDGMIHACYRVKGKPKGSLRVVSAKQRCKRGERKVVWSAGGSSGQAGPTGQTGAAGSNGQQGPAGTNGINGTNGSSSEAALKTEISSLQVKVSGLEETLEGVSNNDLVGTLATVNGLDNNELLGAVNAVKGLTNGELLGSVNAVKGLTNGELLGSVDAVKGLTNGELSGAVETVKGLTNTKLTEAVASLPEVGSLCTQASGLTEQVNLVGEGVSEISLGGVLPVGLTLKLPTLKPLESFSC